MFKKTLLSLAVASSIALTGCLDSGSSNKNAHPAPQYSGDQTEGRTWPVFNPIKSQVPIPSDLMIDKAQGDGTYGVDPDPTNPVITALNELSGASTVAPIDIEMSGAIDPDTVNTQSVFLIPLEYASGDPLQGLSMVEPPTISENLPKYEVSRVELSGKDFIRISPLEPLNPLTRYVVVVTDQVKDAAGQPLISDTTYSVLAGKENLPNPRLADVRNLVQKLWEPIATQYFQAINGPRQSKGLSALSRQNITLTFSLTTSGDEKVLSYIANPASWFSDQLTTFIRVSAAKSVVDDKVDVNKDGKIDYEDVKLAADAAVTYFPINPNDPDDTTIAEALADAEAGFGMIPGCTGVTTGADYISCIGGVLANIPSKLGGFQELLPTPRPRVVSPPSAPIPVSLLSAPVANLVKEENAETPPLVVQGTIAIPYYQGIPTGTDGSAIVTQSWKADDALARAINEKFAPLGLVIPQADPSRSTAVNSIFPFPKQVDADPEAEGVNELRIPWLVVYPNPKVSTGPYPTLIYQHGITTDRSTALSVGALLAQQGYAVIAIDHVGHGVVAATEETKRALAQTLLTAAAKIDSRLGPTETNIEALLNGTITLGAVMQMATVNATTATTYIETVLSGGTTNIDELDQAIKTLKSFENTVANAGSKIPGLPAITGLERHFGFTANAANQPVPMDPQNPTAQDSSGSLFINLTNFANTRDNLRQGVVDLLNLRLSLAAIDLGTGTLDASNVYFVGHSLGGITGASFVAVANESDNDNVRIKAANLLTTGGGIVRMLENSPTFAPRILGGLAAAAGLQQGDADLETFFNIFQATIDSVDPINFADNLKSTNSKVLLTEVIGDEVIPNSAYPDAHGNAQPAPLAGTEPLAKALGAQDITTAGFHQLPGIVRYTAGNHSTPVLPTTGTDEEIDAFTEMVTQIGSLVATGTSLPEPQVKVNDPSIIQQ